MDIYLVISRINEDSRKTEFAQKEHQRPLPPRQTYAKNARFQFIAYK